MSNDHAAAWLAALYADPTDPAYQTEEPWTPTVQELEESLLLALEQGDNDMAVVVATELRRLRGEPPRQTTAGQLYGSKAGVWRLH
jgi:hypothetical protein